MSRFPSTPIDSPPLKYNHLRSATLKAYADLRVGATRAESRAHRTTNNLTLSFDDYGDPLLIKKLLQVLAMSNIQAMFFLQGNWAHLHPQLMAKIKRAGHIVGNHTYSHPDLLRLNDSEIKNEIIKGVTSPWFRPPMGRYNSRVRRIAGELGMSIVYWTIDSDDWQGVSAQYMREKILHELHPGAVILFHLHSNTAIELLPNLIEEIRARGYDFESGTS